MLIDFTEREIALGQNVYDVPDVEDDGSTVDFLFKDSFERISQGVYHVGFDFDWLGKALIKDEFPFSALDKAYWGNLKNETDYSDPEVKKRSEEYWAAKDQQSKDFPNDYGVCDYPEQVAELFPKLKTDPRRFIITAREIRKKDQPEHDGWRWHKWGSYIGTQNSHAEYLADEDEIESVWVFSIIELNDLPEEN